MNGIESIRNLAIRIRDIPEKYPKIQSGFHLFSWESEIDLCKKQMLMAITKNFGESSPYIDELNRIPLPTQKDVQQDFARYIDTSSAFFPGLPGPAPGSFYYYFAKPALNLLDVLISDLESAPIKILDSNAIDLIHNICNKFYLVAEQLKKRHDKRESIKINDEYDVQDLFHALLHIHFDDVRDEETMPSFAGISSRIDFLLENEKIGIEIKKPSCLIRHP